MKIDIELKKIKIINNPIHKRGSKLLGHFSQVETTDKHTLNIFLAIRETSIKSIVGFHLTLVRTALIKKAGNKGWQRCMQRGENKPFLTVGGNVNQSGQQENQPRGSSKKLTRARPTYLSLGIHLKYLSQHITETLAHPVYH